MTGGGGLLRRAAVFGCVLALASQGPLGRTGSSASASSPQPSWHPGVLPLPGAARLLAGGGPRSQTYSTDCYHSVWADPQDANELDARAYGAGYDCSTGAWTFAADTRDTWPDSELAVYEIFIDSDGDPTTGCGGFEWLVAATGKSGPLAAETIRTPSCDTSTWTHAGAAGVGRPSQSSIAVTVDNGLLGSPNDIRWAGFIKGVAESSGDYIPDTTAVPSYHEESGFSNGVCSAPLFSAGGRSMLVTDQPSLVSAMLQPVVGPVTNRGEGVLSFEGDPLSAAAVLGAVGLPSAITADTKFAFQDVPNDQFYGSQWALAQVGASQAWDRTHGSPSVVVADIDSGVDGTHPELAGKLVAGFDATTGSTLVAGNTDADGHGTATAGVIGAATNNGSEIASLGWDTAVMPVKVGDSSGIRASSSIAGLRYAADHGAKVANMSFGSPCHNQSFSDAVAYAESKDVVVVAAAGNDQQNGDYRHYPAAEPGVLAVGATAFDGTVTGYSNVNDYVSLVAPGGSADGNASHDILLLAPGNKTVTEAGTSFSAPLVAAAAALVRALRPDLSANQVAGTLTSTATDMGPPGRDSVSGFGFLNPAAALAAAAGTPRTKPVVRLFGQSRIDTAVAVSNASFASAHSASSAVIASASTFADALPGTPLAVAKNGPLLLTGHDGLDPQVAAELQRALPPGATVYLLGGSFALSPTVATQVQGLGFTVVHYAGTNRFDTAAIIADQGLGNPPTVLEATGLDFPDALSGGAAAAANQAAVLLTAGTAQAAETVAYLSRHPSDTRYALGGQAAAADPSAKPVVGADRYDTSTRVATTFFSNPTRIGVASGVAFPDALSGGANIGAQHGPMILVPRSGPLTAALQSYLKANAPSLVDGVAYGGGLALGDDVLTEVRQAIS